MKKSIIPILTAFIVLLSLRAGAQGFNYKAMITDNGTALANQQIDVRFSILDSVSTLLYQETQTTVTDASGIIVLVVGEGNVVSGDFSTVDWSHEKFLKVEINTGNGYEDFGTTAMKYVPYAKYADKAGNVFSGDFNDLTNVPAGLADGDDDTHLTEAEVDAYVANNGYLTSEEDGDTTNELQTLSINGNQLSISGGNTVTLPSSGDNWGSQTVVTNGSLSGNGTTSSPLSIDTASSYFSDWDKDASDDFSGDYNDLTNKPVTFLEQGTGNTPDSLTDNIYHTGRLSLGYDDNNNTESLLSLSTGNNKQAVSVTNGASADGPAIDNVYSEASTHSIVGFRNQNETNGTGSWTGFLNYMNNNNDNSKLGFSNAIISGGDGICEGVRNNMRTLGLVHGVFNDIGGKEAYGVYNLLYNSTVCEAAYGVKNQIEIGSKEIGVYNHIITFQNDNQTIVAGTVDSIWNEYSPNVYGSKTYIYNYGSNNNSYEVHGVSMNIVDNSTGGAGNTVTGNYIDISGSSSATKIGVDITIYSSEGGLHYGLYSYVLGEDNYAGYFVGNVAVEGGNLDVYNGSKLTNNLVSGDADMKAYVYGLVYYNGNTDGNRSSAGFTVSKTATGTYEVTLTHYSGQYYIVSATAEIGGGGTPVFATTDYSSTGGKFIIRTYDTNGNLIDNSFHFVVFKK